MSLCGHGERKMNLSHWITGETEVLPDELTTEPEQERVVIQEEEEDIFLAKPNKNFGFPLAFSIMICH